MADKSAWWLALVGTGGAIFGSVVTGAFNYLGHRGDLDAKMIELSVGILRSEPRPETEPLREWAIDVIGKRARFEFDVAQRSALLKKELPFKAAETAQLEALLLSMQQSIQAAAANNNSSSNNAMMEMMMKMMREKQMQENERKNSPAR